MADRYADDRQLRDRALYLARLVAEGKASDQGCREALADMAKHWPDHRFKAWNGNRDIAEEARHQIMTAIMSPGAFDWERCAGGIVAWVTAISRRTAHKVVADAGRRRARLVLADTTDTTSDRWFVKGNFVDSFVARVNDEFDVSQALGPTARLDERCRAFCELFELPQPVPVTHSQSRAARQLLRGHGSAKEVMRRFLTDELTSDEEASLFAVFAEHGWTVWERVARITLHLADNYADAAWASLTYPGRAAHAAS